MNTLCNGATFSFKIKPGKISELVSLLNMMKPDPANNTLFPMGKSNLLHYASWVLAPAEKMPNDKMLPQRLLLLTTYWGKKSTHIKELTQLAPSGLHQLLSCCQDYTESVAAEKYLSRFLKRHSVGNSVYNAFQYATVDDVKNEEALRKELEDFLDKESLNPSFLRLSGREIRQRIQQHVQGMPEFKWATVPWKRGFTNYWAYYGSWIVMRVVVLLMVLVALFGLFHHNIVSTIVSWLLVSIALLGGLMMAFFRLNEIKLAVRVKSNVNPPTDEEIKIIADQENEMICNEMTVTGPLKQGFIRPVFLFVLLTIATIRRAYIFIPTVHTARWLQVDRGRRIVFIASFDNTSDGYARDFVDSARRTKKVNLILGNGDGYPHTRWALHEGGKDASGYMNTVRKQQKLTNVWYSTHKELSILNVLNNQLIRRGLWGEMNDEEIKKWLQYF